MKIFSSIAVILMVMGLLTGCPKKQTIVSEEAKAPAVDMEADAKAEAEAKAKAKKEAEAKIKAEARAKAEAAAKAELAAKEALRFEDIHFDFDMYEIKGNDKEILSDLADWLLKNKNANLLLEGHADDRGNSAYNLALGDRRAHSAKDYLVALGVSGARISTTSYGQEKPICSEPNEECWWKNRRVHFDIRNEGITGR